MALILSWLFFIFVMLLLCFASMNNNVRVRNLNLPWYLRGGGMLKCDWVIEIQSPWLLYLSLEMESVVFVQMFCSIIFFFYFILGLIYIGTKCYAEMLITWMKHVIIYSFWFNTYTYINARLISRTWNMLFAVSMLPCP